MSSSMKKTLDTTSILNELRGASVFFGKPKPASSTPPPETKPEQPPVKAQAPDTNPSPAPAEQKEGTVFASTTAPAIEGDNSRELSEDASTLSREQASKHDSTIASDYASMLAEVRKAIQEIGKEVSYVRLTAGEKQRIMDALYGFRRHGIRISENEFARIAINFLIEDHKANGEKSLLSQILKP